MKKSIFKRAWYLFKKYSITFSQALIKSWNDYKRDLLIEIYNKIPSKSQFSKKKVEAKKSWQNFTEVTFKCAPRNLVINSGAAAYYNGSNYNAD